VKMGGRKQGCKHRGFE